MARAGIVQADVYMVAVFRCDGSPHIAGGIFEVFWNLDWDAMAVWQLELTVGFSVTFWFIYQGTGTTQAGYDGSWRCMRRSTIISCEMNFIEVRRATVHVPFAETQIYPDFKG